MAKVRTDRSVKVDGIKTFDSIVVDNQFIKPIEGKGGKLIAVYLTLENTGKESGNMAFSRFRLVDSQGRKYDELDDWMSQSAWLKESGLESANAQLFPGGTSKTAKLFRVAEDTQEIKLMVNYQEFKLPDISTKSTENSVSDRQLDRQSITSSAAYKTVRSKVEEIYNNPTAKSEHDRLCAMADRELSTDNDDAKKIAAFCLAVDTCIKKKMTQEITDSISNNNSSNESMISPDTAVVNHYRSIDNREIERSWDDLSPNFKGSNLTKGFNKYTDWWDSVEKVYISDTRVVKSSETSSIVKTNLTYKLRSGRVMNDKKKYIYLTWTNGKWLIDGKSEKYNN